MTTKAQDDVGVEVPSGVSIRAGSSLDWTPSSKESSERTSPVKSGGDEATAKKAADVPMQRQLWPADGNIDANKVAGDQELQTLRDEMRKMRDDLRALMAKSAIQDEVIHDWEAWYREQEEVPEQGKDAEGRDGDYEWAEKRANMPVRQPEPELDWGYDKDGRWIGAHQDHVSATT